MMSNYPIQSARTVAYRVFCLGILLKRNILEQGMQRFDELPDPIKEGWKREHEGIHHRLRQWVIEEKLIDHFSTNERLLFDADLGEWQQLDQINISWRVESLGVLLWAMDIMQVPYYDTQFDVETLLEPLDLMSPTIDFIWQVHLSEAQVIHKARDLAELWHWRSRTTQLQEQGVTPTQDMTYEDIIKDVAIKMYERGDLPEPIDNDFPVLGKSYSKLTQSEYNILSSIAMERHYALNWLCKYSDNWDDVSTDT